jgi:SAM-dependent methyltransferase
LQARSTDLNLIHQTSPQGVTYRFPLGTDAERAVLTFPAEWKSYERASVIYRMARQMGLLGEVQTSVPRRILVDVGVGRGFYVPSYLRMGLQVVGIDLNPENLQYLQSTFGGRDSVALTRASAGALPIQDGAVDIVFLCQTLEHLLEPMVALREAFRILRPGGYLFVDVPWMHEVYRPLSFVLLRLLQAMRGDSAVPRGLRPWMRINHGSVRLRRWTRYAAKLLNVVPAFRGIEVESFVNAYRSGHISEGDLHLHAYLPAEWLKLITSVGFRVAKVTGAWLAPPPFNRWRWSNEAFERLRKVLPDSVASKVCQILVILARKAVAPK